MTVKRRVTATACVLNNRGARVGGGWGPPLEKAANPHTSEISEFLSL